MGGLVRQHGDSECGVVPGAEAVLEHNAIQRPADPGLEKGQRSLDERDSRGVRADTREGIALVTDDRDRMPCDPGGLRRVSPLGPRPIGRRHRPPAGIAVDAVGVGEQDEADCQHENERQALAAARPRRSRRQNRLSGLVERLDPAEVGILDAREPPRGRALVGSETPLADAANDELELGGGEDREGQPERNRGLQPAGEQPEHHEAETADPYRGLGARPRDASARVKARAASWQGLQALGQRRGRIGSAT